MSLAATVLIPTHNHGDLLVHSVRSVLAQTVQDIEVFIIGDGVTEATRRVALDLARQDERVRFFDNPKGPHRGELHRHTALSHARGEIVCYLSDDDLWLPDHIESMQRLLAEADFAHALPLYVGREGQLVIRPVDLALPFFREMHLTGANRIGTSFGSHTLDMYRRLPAGWRTTPEYMYTDVYMWQQFLTHPHCRVISGARPTVLSFPDSVRPGWSPEQRLAELELWANKVRDPLWRAGFIDDALSTVARNHAQLEAKYYRTPFGYLGKRLLFLSYGGAASRRMRIWLLGLPVIGKLIRSVGEALIGPLAR
jgi:GalNAc5-diNAcBac-PP-undecaprenol beta-1,3-glucosyltransferase